MAGETVKSPNLVDAQAGVKREARYKKGRMVIAGDLDAILSTETELNDVHLFDILIPSNAIVHKIEVYNDDLDSHACPLLATDIGLYAAQAFTSVTSGTETKRVLDVVLDADVYVDGATTLQAATTSWTALAFDAGTKGPDDADKMAWEDLGYDVDPNVMFRIGMVSAAAAATGAAGDLGIRVTYIVD